MSSISPAVSRRDFLALVSAALTMRVPAAPGSASEYPQEVAGVRLPHTPLCSKAYGLCRSGAPTFLQNHSLRTYVFGALHAAHHHQSFDAETAFVAAILHDIGLLETFASKEGSFEIDGANRAELLVREQGASAGEASAVWNAIVMHDMRFVIPFHQSAEATLVAAGAAADVIGPDMHMISEAAVQEVVAAFPRLQFKNEFIGLLARHCQRKPGVQTGTWLEGFCQQHSSVPESGTERAIRAAPFSE
jgi:cyanamide hydratase family protein with HD domain